MNSTLYEAKRFASMVGQGRVKARFQNLCFQIVPLGKLCNGADACFFALVVGVPHIAHDPCCLGKNISALGAGSHGKSNRSLQHGTCRV